MVKTKPMIGFFLLVLLLWGGRVEAQETSLIAILKAKGILSEEEVRRLSSKRETLNTPNLQALVELLQAKGILGPEDLRSLKLSGPQPPLEPKPAAPPKNPLAVGYKDGFFVRSADGHLSLRLGGRVTTHALFQQEDTEQNGTLLLDRVRLSLQGTFYQYFDFKIQNDFTRGLGLRDAYLSFNYAPQARVRIGQFKVPFSYEALTSKRYIDFVERSAVALSAVRPSRDIGLMLHGQVGEGFLGYQLALLNGSGQNRPDSNSAKDLAVRLVWTPFLSSQDSFLSKLSIGGALTFGHQPRGKSLSGLTPTGFEFFSPVEVRGKRMRVGGHTAWFWGPYSLKGEWVYTSEERKGLGPAGEDLSDFVGQGGYIGGTWLLTGETKIPNKPNRPARVLLDPTGPQGGWGSWEVAARYEYFLLDNKSDGKPGALKRNRFDGVRVGLNWYPNPRTRFSLEYLYSFFEDSQRSPRPHHHSLNSLLSRIQLEF